MNFSKNLAVRIPIWFEMGKNRKKFWHSLTTAASNYGYIPLKRIDSSLAYVLMDT